MSSPDALPVAKPAMPWVWLGVGSVCLSTIAKLELIGSGPDAEPDAYGHALAARLLMENPADLEVHWVWLPLGHVVSALLLALGCGMDGMRYFNCVLTSFLALGTARAIGRGSTGIEAEGVRWTAAAVVALSPLSLSTGESGVLEPLFLGLVMASTCAIRRGHAITAGAIAACAALLRYEGWFLPPVFLWIWWRSGRPRAAAWAWLLPLFTIGAYVALRASVHGTALSFVRANADFARSFYTDVAVLWPVQANVAWMSMWYAVIVPAVVLGPLMPFALAGTPWIVRHGPRPLTGALLAILLFLTLGFVARQHMGLLRHALTLMPIYAIAAAAGLLAGARYLHRRLALARMDIERWTFACAVVALSVFAMSRTLPTFFARSSLHERVHHDDALVAEALKAAWSERARVFCDVTAVETLSELPPRSFVRWKLPDTRALNMELERARGHDVLVVSTEARTHHLRKNLRELQAVGDVILYRYVSTGAAVAEQADLRHSAPIAPYWRSPPPSSGL